MGAFDACTQAQDSDSYGEVLLSVKDFDYHTSYVYLEAGYLYPIRIVYVSITPPPILLFSIIDPDSVTHETFDNVFNFNVQDIFSCGKISQLSTSKFSGSVSSGSATLSASSSTPASSSLVSSSLVSSSLVSSSLVSSGSATPSASSSTPASSSLVSSELVSSSSASSGFATPSVSSSNTQPTPYSVSSSSQVFSDSSILLPGTFNSASRSSLPITSEISSLHISSKTATFTSYISSSTAGYFNSTTTDYPSILTTSLSTTFYCSNQQCTENTIVTSTMPNEASTALVITKIDQTITSFANKKSTDLFVTSIASVATTPLSKAANTYTMYSLISVTSVATSSKCSSSVSTETVILPETTFLETNIIIKPSIISTQKTGSANSVVKFTNHSIFSKYISSSLISTTSSQSISSMPIPQSSVLVYQDAAVKYKTVHNILKASFIVGLLALI